MHTTEQLNRALAGRYTIDRLIGEGGMATVYLARDLRHQRGVALKVLKPDLGAVVGVERFLSEIQVTANLQHPNLLPLFDSGAADELLFYVMPFVEGESLRARLDREKQLPIEEAVRLAATIASALDYAHRRGVIHRDLKPENILIHEGQPLVADFGIALALSNAGGNRITQTGLSLGTPQYMSPEQATGDRVIDARTDIYSLGAVTYEMLAGEAPHTGATSQAIIARLLTEKPRSIRAGRPSVSEQIEAAVECALEKLPADRWATAKEFGEALTGARIVTRPAGVTAAARSGTAGRRPAARELIAWGLASVGIVALGLGGWRRDPGPSPATRVEFEVILPDSLYPSSDGAVANLSISRDGSMVVFQGTNPPSGPVMYLRHLDDPTVERIRGTDSTRSPVISPDGSEIIVTPVGGGGGDDAATKRIAIRGGTARPALRDTAAQISWGDGDFMVFARGGRLYSTASPGGAPRLLATPDSMRRHVRYGHPDLLPDGTAALITIWKGVTVLDSVVLGVVSIPDGRVTELGISGTYPQYSGTGHVVYATSDGVVFAKPFSASSRRTSATPFPVVEGVRVGAGGGASFAVSQNGTLAYVRGGSVRRRVLVAVSRNGTERLLGAKDDEYAHPRVSPDGRQIAVTAGVPASGTVTPDIWRFDIASKALTRVTADSSSVRAAWSRDGERIAYGRQPGRSADSAVFWRPLYASSQATPLLRASTPVLDFSLGPAGGYSAMKVRVGTGGSDDIWLVHMDSLTAPRPFLREPYGEKNPRVSPDGRLLAYVTNRTGRDEVYVCPIPGPGAAVQVSEDGGREPVWSPDGRELFYRTATTLMSARLAPGSRPAVVQRDSLFRDVYGRNNNVSNYDVFPGGQEFVMLRGSQVVTTEAERPPLMIVLNWHLAASARSEARQR